MVHYQYSPRYSCDGTIYRHVIVEGCAPSPIKAKRLMSEDEWRELGICQSEGWEHYGYSHCDEKYPTLLFKKKDDNKTT